MVSSCLEVGASSLETVEPMGNTVKTASYGSDWASLQEFVCNARDPSSIPGLGRSTGEGIGYPLQYSWASLVAQLVKNPPAMWKTRL